MYWPKSIKKLQIHVKMAVAVRMEWINLYVNVPQAMAENDVKRKLMSVIQVSRKT